MLLKTLPALVLVIAAAAAVAQEIVREDQLESLRAELGDVTSRVQSRIADTSASMSALSTVDAAERTGAAYELLDAIEAETRAVLEQVSRNSPFMDALDDARARVVTILRKHEREPPSPRRDARIARLTAALTDLEAQYTQVQNAESTMTRLLSDHAVMRREIQLDDSVGAVEDFVANLGRLTDELDAMTVVLSEVSATTIDTSEDATPIDQ